MQIDYIVHESQMARMERIIKRLWILAIILIVLLFGTSMYTMNGTELY